MAVCLFIANFDVAPDEEVEELAIDADFAEVKLYMISRGEVQCEWLERCWREAGSVGLRDRGHAY